MLVFCCLTVCLEAKVEIIYLWLLQSELVMYQTITTMSVESEDCLKSMKQYCNSQD